MIYLDHAAATAIDKRVLATMQPYFSDNFYNPSATYLAAQHVHKELETARHTVAQWLGARKEEVVFTAGATEANNLAIHGVMQKWPKGSLVVSGIEHDSVLKPAAQYDSRLIPVNAEGLVDLDKLAANIHDHTVLVSIMYANNEVGSVQAVAKVAQLLKKIRRGRAERGITRPLYFHTDAAQAPNYLDLHVARLGVDLMTLNGSKIYGPKQSGCLYIRSGIDLAPLISGGGQEHNLRSGTENVAGSIGFAAALNIAQTMRHTETTRMHSLQEEFFTLLTKKIPNVIINGPRRSRLPNNVHVTLPGQDNERLVMQLDEQGILCAAGSACSASSEEASHVLTAMGISETAAQSSLRFSMGRETKSSDVQQTVQTLKVLLDQ